MEQTFDKLPDFIHVYDPAQFDATELEKALATLDEQEEIVTIILSMETAGAETRKNPIRFKNALQEAGRKTSSAGVEKNLDRLGALTTESHDFWQHQTAGLLMVISGLEEVHAFTLTEAPEEAVHVGPYPRMLPLLTNLGEESVYVLALDLNETRLFSVTPTQTHPISLDSVPTSLDEAMKFDDPEESLQFRATSRSSGKDNTNVAYHGHGVTGDEEKNRQVDRFFEMIDSGLTSHFKDQNTPLYLLGPSHEIGRYRSANNYPHLREHSVDHNPSSLDESELDAALKSIAVHHRDESRAGDRERLGQHVSDGSGSREVTHIVTAALSGRIGTLFVDETAEIWGTVDPTTFATVESEPDDENAVDLLDLTARQTVLAGGRVRVDTDASLLESAPMAAIYRY